MPGTNVPKKSPAKKTSMYKDYITIIKALLSLSLSLSAMKCPIIRNQSLLFEGKY